MRRINGKWECVNCGASLDVPEDKKPRVMLVGASGRKNERVILVDGEEVHRCEVRPPD